MKKENNRRRFPGESSRNRPDKASERRKFAQQRQAQSDTLTPQQRLEKLDIKFGIGVGAKRERAKLLKRINVKSDMTNINSLDKKQLPDDIMQEIAAINDELGSKKRLKAKERRAQEQKD